MVMTANSRMQVGQEANSLSQRETVFYLKRRNGPGKAPAG